MVLDPDGGDYDPAEREVLLREVRALSGCV